MTITSLLFMHVVVMVTLSIHSLSLRVLTGYETRPPASQESHHSAMPRQLQNELIMLENISTKPALLWPRMSDAASWSKLDQVVKHQPSPHLTSPDQLINNLELIIYEEAKNLFGVKPAKKPKTVSRREGEIARCRANIRELKKTYKRMSSDEDKSAIASLTNEYRFVTQLFP